MMLAIAGIAGAVIIGGGIKFFLDHAGPQPERTPPGEVVQPAMPAPQAPPKKVKWVINTDPPGAEIVRLPENKVFGKTPFQQEAQVVKPATVELALRLPGHQEKKLKFNTGEDFTAMEKLTPIGEEKNKEEAKEEDDGGKKKKKKKKGKKK